MNDPHAVPRHPVRVVSQRTGLSAHVLRAWERRYDVVSPSRSEGGRRLYSDQDIERFNLIRRATAAGHSIGMVAGLDDADLRAMVVEVEEAAPTAGREDGQSATAEESVALCLHYMEALDGASLERTLRRSAVVLGVWDLVLQVLVPLIHEVGERWHSGRISPAHEHLATSVISRTLSWIMDSTSSNSSAPIMVAATPSGEPHELGAMLAAAAAAAEGWRVVYLGPNLPAEDIANAAKQVGAVCVAVSIVYPESASKAVAQVARMRELLAPTTAIIVGGPTQPEENMTPANGVHFVRDIAELPQLLETLSSI
jgi:methanogenic corrinoid protein MtbC1